MKRMYAAAAVAVLFLGSAPAWADGSSTACYTYWEQVPAAPETAVWYVEREVCPEVPAPVPPGSPKTTVPAKKPAKKTVSPKVVSKKPVLKTPSKPGPKGASAVVRHRGVSVVSLKRPQTQRSTPLAVSSSPAPTPTVSAPAEMSQEKKLADTGTRGWALAGIAVGLVVAGIGVGILVRRKNRLG